MNPLGKFILHKITSLPGPLAFSIFLMTAKLLFAFIIKTIGKVKDLEEQFVNKKFWETAESLFLQNLQKMKQISRSGINEDDKGDRM